MNGVLYALQPLHVEYYHVLAECLQYFSYLQLDYDMYKILFCILSIEELCILSIECISVLFQYSAVLQCQLSWRPETRLRPFSVLQKASTADISDPVLHEPLIHRRWVAHKPWHTIIRALESTILCFASCLVVTMLCCYFSRCDTYSGKVILGMPVMRQFASIRTHGPWIKMIWSCWFVKEQNLRSVQAVQQVV